MTGFRELPQRTLATRPFKVGREDLVARQGLAQKVTSLLARSRTNGTQLLDVTEPSTAAVVTPAARVKRAIRNPHPIAIRAACLAALVLTLHIPVFADDPSPEARGSAQIIVTSRKWMQIQLNREPAGYAPIKLSNLKAGLQHLEWKSATGQGEFRLKVQAGDTVRLVENARGQLVRY